MVIAVCNNKGGVGKSTTVINLSRSLALRGKSVMAIDLDGQGNLSKGLNTPNSPHNIYTCFQGKSTLRQAVTRCWGMDLIPASPEMSRAEVEFAARSARESILTKLIRPLRSQYDFILIDCPPQLGLFTTNALVASDRFLVPLQGSFFSVEGLASLLATAKDIALDLEVPVSLLGIFLTRFNGRRILSQQVRESVQAQLGHLLMNTVIRENVSLDEAQSQGMPVVDYDPQSNGAKDYELLTTEILTRP